MNYILASILILMSLVYATAADALIRITLMDVEALPDGGCFFQFGFENNSPASFDQYYFDLWYYDSEGWRVGSTYYGLGRFGVAERVKVYDKLLLTNCDEIDTITIRTDYIETQFEPVNLDDAPTVVVNSAVPDISLTSSR